MSTILPANVKITGEFTPDPDICRFVINQPILEEGWTLICRSAEEAKGSVLLEVLFADDAVAQVNVTGSALVVRKSVRDAWPKVAARLIPSLKKTIAQGGELISAEAIRRMKESYNEEDIAGQIQDLIEAAINPQLASHGGWVRLVKMENRDVYLEMGGGCQGCAASKQTLKFGIERAIRDLCPQVREIIDVTDHASGTNPYYES